MVKHLIVVHGRSIKPAEAKMKLLVRDAVAHGLTRLGDIATVNKLKSGKVKLSLAYFGDISNEIQAEDNDTDRDALTEKDPAHGNKKALSHQLIKNAMTETMTRYPKFTLSAYKKVLRDAADNRFFDEAVSVISFLGAIATFGILNEKAIEFGKADMGRYLLSQKTGSEVRSRLQKILVPSIRAGDDIMLLTHSMGCMVAYDVLWKFTHRSEYENVRDAANLLSCWVTIGCPLAEPGVRNNLLDGHLHFEDDKYPRNMVRTWKNFWAEDDYISHKSRMKNAFSRVRTKMGIDNITDKKIYNCWVYTEKGSTDLISNPHDLYGYLLERNVSTAISNWAQQ